ncbi:MAG TPA: TonB-dependent receptor, partial [Balneolaceae bacterium]|nr:TonB-dependent receptor [Balneolaceae bacterium]
MHRIKQLFIFVILLLFSNPLIAQSIIEGRVLDQQTRQPLIGVNVTVPGTTIGTATNKKGYFKLQPAKEVGQLQFNYVGYLQKKIQIKGEEDFLNVLLKPNNVVLNELQVVGFSRDKNLQGTGASIALVTDADLERGNQVSLKGTLNTVPGVQVDQSAMGESRISVRGAGISAPWGIRDIKIYMNNIPITQANGVARIEAIDVST